MKYDQYGQAHCSTEELCELLYQNPDLDVSYVMVDDSADYNNSVKSLFVDMPLLRPYLPLNYKEEVPLELFDHVQQQAWHMPKEYKTLDIAQHILDLCTTEPELQRVGQELLLFQERDLFDLLRFLKYFVDTMRKNGVVWGLGRGSSVASYVLYLLGVHRINSLYYDLPIEEFLK